MEGFGAFLKHEREERGLTLREAAQVTKISTHNLEMLEAERFDELGGEIFVRGFLRSYSRYLGLDSADLMRRYEEQCGRPRPVSNYTGHEESDAVYLANDKQKRHWPLAVLGAAALIALFAWISWDGQGGGTSERASRQASYPVSVTLEAAPAPVTTAAMEEVPAAEPEAVPEPITTGPAVSLSIHTDQVTWMQVWVDHGLVRERELPADYVWRIQADEQVEILTGNAGGFRLELNGEMLPRLGPEGQVRRRVITADGVFSP